MASSALLHPPPLRLRPLPNYLFAPPSPLNSRLVTLIRGKSSPKCRSLIVCFALAESDSPKSLDSGGGDDGEILPLLEQLAVCLEHPADYLAKLPDDLRLDLNDAAFDLAKGPVMDECGKELGEIVLNLSRAWEKADTSSSNSIARQLPSLYSSLKSNVKSAFGRRLIAAGRRFESMGLYGQGELQKAETELLVDCQSNDQDRERAIERSSYRNR